MTTYKETIAALISATPFGIDTDIQMSGRPPTMASSEFLTNKEQGDWAEHVVFNAINENSDKYCAIRYGRADSLAAGDLGFSDFYSEYQTELNNLGKKPDLLIFRRSDVPKGENRNFDDDDFVRRSIAAIEVRSSSFLANKYSAFMEDRTLKAETECNRIQNILLQEPLSSLLIEKSPELHGLIRRATSSTFRELDFRLSSWSSSDDLRSLSKYLKLLKEQIKVLHKRDYLSITPKLEDMALVNRWIQRFGVRHYYLQVFFDKAYVISFKDILTLSSDSQNEGVIFSVERDIKNQGKTTIEINVQVGKEILGRIDMPEHRSALKELDRGRLLFYVTFQEVEVISTQQFFHKKLSKMLEYIQHVGDTHRKSFGQYFTHPDVAGFMTRWVLRSGKKSLFDPAFGLGAFRDAVPQDSKVTFSACEIDPRIIKFWERQTGERSGFIAGEDYLRSWGGKHDNIACNPPYMRFQKFLNRGIVFQEFQRHLGIRLSGYTNTASAFLLKSLSELRASGRMAYIMPLEFLHTGYGSLVKEKLIASRHLFAILRFDCEKDIFPDATTSVGIILYDTAVRHTSVKFYAVQSLTQLAMLDAIEPVSDVPLEELDPKSKWLPLFQKQAYAADPAKMTTLDSFGRFSRGIATGANEFFVLRPSTAKEKGIDRKSECVPCITRSSQLYKPVLDPTDYDALSDADHPVLLFSANGAHSKEAETYIQFGERQGFNDRFLTKNRTPWYKTEQREPSPLLLGVFSRGGYKIIFNKSQVLNLTCFHGFQPNPFGREYIEHLFLYLSSRTGREIISLSMRQYGASLDKFEPNDLNGSSVPSQTFFASISAEKVATAVRALSETGQVPQWAEDLFASLKIPNKMVHGTAKLHRAIANIEHGRDIRKESQGLARIMP